MMAKVKIAVTIDRDVLLQLDHLVAARRFPNRSQAVESALTAQLQRLQRARLARESARLNRREEKAIAEQGLAADMVAWPEY